MNNKKVLGAALGVAGLVTVAILMSKSAAGGGGDGGGAPKFKVGDHITYKDRNPLNIIYVVTEYVNGTYTLAQWWEGQAVNPVPGYLPSVIDANYVLV